MNLFNFIPGYDTAIYATGREPAFIMLLSFVITFILTRGYTRIARVRGWGSVSVGDVHTHHVVFGIIIAFIAGALMFGFTPASGTAVLFLAAMFGCGVALVLDEFALVFHLQDVYWENEGRKSIDAVVLALVFGLLFLLNITPFDVGDDSTGLLIAFSVAVNLLIALLAALKGKIYMAIFGVFVPLLSIIGAIRLAEPGSIWAKKLYRKNGKKIIRSEKRYLAYERVWRTRKERAWDFIGGKTGRPVKK